MGGLSSGRKEEERKGKESHHLVTKVLLFTNNISASQPARGHTHTLLLATSYFRDTVDILGRLILGQSTRYHVFLWIIFSSLSGRRDDGRAGGGWKLGGGGGGEGGDTQLDGRTDGRWADGFYGGTSVVHILFLCPVFLRVFFAESKRERERERRIPCGSKQLPVAASSASCLQPPSPIPNTHTHIIY